jgi:hypothetical protein
MANFSGMGGAVGKAVASKGAPDFEELTVVAAGTVRAVGREAAFDGRNPKAVIGAEVSVSLAPMPAESLSVADEWTGLSTRCVRPRRSLPPGFAPVVVPLRSVDGAFRIDGLFPFPGKIWLIPGKLPVAPARVWLGIAAQTPVHRKTHDSQSSHDN